MNNGEAIKCAGKRLKDTTKIVSSVPSRSRFDIVVYRININIRVQPADRNTAAFVKQMFNFRN